MLDVSRIIGGDGEVDTKVEFHRVATLDIKQVGGINSSLNRWD